MDALGLLDCLFVAALAGLWWYFAEVARHKQGDDSVGLLTHSALLLGGPPSEPGAAAPDSLERILERIGRAGGYSDVATFLAGAQQAYRLIVEAYARGDLSAVEHLLTPAEFSKKVMLDLMQPANSISRGYRTIADFVMRGLVSTIMTTNFNPCLPDALRERQPHIRQINEVNRSPGDTAQFDIFNKCQVVWLHGRAEHYSDKHVAGEVGAADPALVSLLRPLLDASPIIVVGYRGAEPSIKEGIFGQLKQGRLDFPKGIYWCLRHGEALRLVGEISEEDDIFGICVPDGA